MNTRALLLAALVAAAPLAAAPVFAQQPTVAVRSVRLTAADPAKVADFYKRTFGMSEVQRYERPTSLEVILNFGATVEAAQASRGPRLVIITPPVSVCHQVSMIGQRPSPTTS